MNKETCTFFTVQSFVMIVNFLAQMSYIFSTSTPSNHFNRRLSVKSKIITVKFLVRWLCAEYFYVVDFGWHGKYLMKRTVEIRSKYGYQTNVPLIEREVSVWIYKYSISSEPRFAQTDLIGSGKPLLNK